MPSVLLVVVLALAWRAHSLPEIAIGKRDKESHGATAPAARRAVGLKKRGGTVGTNIFDVLDWSDGGAYYANITVGTPPQQQVVLLDTGSSDLYFDSSSAAACHTTGLSSCQGGAFNANDSSSYSVAVPAPAFNTSFGDGSTAVGPFGQDVIGIGDVTISNVQFGVAEVVDSTSGYATGLMGIGYSENEATNHTYPNIPEVLADSGVINSRLYSVYLNDESDISGSILFGGIDTTKYSGDLITLDLLPDVDTGLIDQFVSVVTAVNITVSGTTHEIFSGGATGVQAYEDDDNSLPVLLDTGSTAWSLPQDVWDDKFASVFSYVNSSGFCSCKYMDSDDSVTLEFGGQVNIKVPAREFVVPYYDPSTRAAVPFGDGTDACAFLIGPASPTGEGFQTLGDAVLRSMYVVFDLDNGQVSIAQAAVNSTVSPKIVTVQAGPTGVAGAVSGVVTVAPNSYSIAAAVASATGSLGVSTGQSTIGTATGTAAVPEDAQVSAVGSGSAVGLVAPGAAAWSSVCVVGVAVFMASVGFGITI